MLSVGVVVDDNACHRDALSGFIWDFGGTGPHTNITWTCDHEVSNEASDNDVIMGCRER